MRIISKIIRKEFHVSIKNTTEKSIIQGIKKPQLSRCKNLHTVIYIDILLQYAKNGSLKYLGSLIFTVVLQLHLSIFP